MLVNPRIKWNYQVVLLTLNWLDIRILQWNWGSFKEKEKWNSCYIKGIFWTNKQCSLNRSQPSWSVKNEVNRDNEPN